MNCERKTNIQNHDDGRQSELGDNQRAPASVWKDLFAGGIAGTAGIFIGHPFDTIKVRLQQQHQNPLQHHMSKEIQTVALKGSHSTYRGLFQGIGAPLATAAIVNASVFAVYGTTSRLWDTYYSESSMTMHSDSTTDLVEKQAFCGAVTGLTTSLVLSPIEYIKIRLQTMNLRPDKGPQTLINSGSRPCSSFQLAKEIIGSSHGLRGLYRGLFATILRQTPSLALYFPVYNILKRSIDDIYISGVNNESTTSDMQSLWWSSAMAGGLAGCLSWTLVYPIDAVKSRIQSMPLDVSAKERSIIHITRSISRNEGFVKLTLSRGLAITLLRAFPVNGTIFFVYESVSQKLRAFDDYDWGGEQRFIDTRFKSGSTKTELKSMPRRSITLRLDGRVVNMADVSCGEAESR